MLRNEYSLLFTLSVFNAKALSAIRDAVILEFFCVPKVD